MTRSPSHEKKLVAWLRDRPLDPSELPTTPDDWSTFTAEAIHSGLSGLILEHATKGGIEIPAPFAEALRQSAFRVAGENLHALRELESVLAVLHGGGVPVLLLKGAALNLTLYPRMDLRPMTDLDVLVPFDQARSAVDWLERHGCRRGAALVRDDFFPRFYYEVEYFTPSPRPVRLDVHARPLRPLRYACFMPDGALWEGARSINVGSVTAQVPHPSLMFLHLAAHAAFHGCERLIWLYDLRRLVESHGAEIDWPYVARRCREWKLSLAVRTAVDRTAEALGPFVPEWFRSELRAHSVDWQDRWVVRQAPRDGQAPVAHVLGTVLTTPQWRLRLGFLAAQLLPHREHLVSRSADHSEHPHYLARLRRLGRIAAHVTIHGLSAGLGFLTGWRRALPKAGQSKREDQNVAGGTSGTRVEPSSRQATAA